MIDRDFRFALHVVIHQDDGHEHLTLANRQQSALIPLH